MVGRCGGRGAAASKSRWITTSPLDIAERVLGRGRAALRRRPTLGPEFSALLRARSSDVGRDGSASDRAADRHQHAKLAEGLEWAAPGGTGSQGRGRAASRASRPAPQNGTRVWQRRSCPRSTETTWMPRTILAVATRIMPAAAAVMCRRPRAEFGARSASRRQRPRHLAAGALRC